MPVLKPTFVSFFPPPHSVTDFVKDLERALPHGGLTIPFSVCVPVSLSQTARMKYLLLNLLLCWSPIALFVVDR